MPRRSATRRASSMSSGLQQLPHFAAPSYCQTRRVIPRTSWPCSFKSAAAADESTPPLIATTTRITPPGGEELRSLHDLVQHALRASKAAWTLGVWLQHHRLSTPGRPLERPEGSALSVSRRERALWHKCR